VGRDGSFELFGLRIWLDGAPHDGDTLTVRVLATNELEDPHLRLVMVMNPLPAPADEALVFSDAVLADMRATFPDELGALIPDGASWGSLTDAAKRAVRAHYHRYLLICESSGLVVLDTGSLGIDILVGSTPALEPFKRLHRFVDVLKAREEQIEQQLENTRRARLLAESRLGDPEVEKVTVVATSAVNDPLVAIAAGLDE
jgi:hypothetical protein